MPRSKQRRTDVGLLDDEELRKLLPEEINDGDISIPPAVDLDPAACNRLREFLDKHIADAERANQAYNSTVEHALRRHAAADPKPAWPGLIKSVKQQAKDAKVLLRALEAAEAHAQYAPRRREMSLLTRASGVIDAGGPPRYRYLDSDAKMRSMHDPVGYRAFAPETAALRQALARRVKVFDLALDALDTIKGRPRGSVLYPLILRLGRCWKYAAQVPPTYWRQQEEWDGPLDRESRTAVTGLFYRYCRLSLNCLPAEKRHGAPALGSAVRTICDTWGTIKADYTDDLYRM